MRSSLHALANLLAALIALLALTPFAQAAGNRVALLIGIAEYQNVTSLQGPENDVTALRAVLIERWGFAPGSVRTLVNRHANREAILGELRALSQRSAAGDDVFIFYSGHGTSALDVRLSPPLPYGTGAMVPFDYDPNSAQPLAGLIVGRRDLQPLIEQLEGGGRRLWVVSDSCYSAHQVRNVFGERGPLPGKLIPPPGSELRQGIAYAAARPATPPPPYPYRNTAYLAAAAEGEVARDIPAMALPRYPTFDGQPHGALADALLRVLWGKVDADYDRDGFLSWAEIHIAVSDFMADRAYGHGPQRLPSVVEDAGGLAQRAFLGQRITAPARTPSPPANLRLATVGVDSAGVAALQRIRGVDLLPGSATSAEVIVSREDRRLVLYSGGGDRFAEVASGDLKRLVMHVQQLAWARRLRELGREGSRGLLDFQVQPAVFGGNFKVGERINFIVRPDRASTLLVINVDAEGFVSVLYPFLPHELDPLQAGTAREIPGSSPQDLVKVTLPLGMDLLFAFAFDRPPAEFEKVLTLRKLEPTDPRLALIERLLADRKGEFSFARAELRVLTGD